MTEADAVQRATTPATVESLRTNLAALGIRRGMTLLVHSSLGALGWVNGGPVAVITALEELLGAEGTLVMPTHSADLSDPAQWKNPPVPQVWWDTIRDTMPAFDPDLTPTRKMGRIPETFRKQNGVLRSSHPCSSFAAWGRHALEITANHALEFSLGEESPLARVFDLGGWVLLIGVGHSNNTSLHLAEYRVNFPNMQVITHGAPMMVRGHREWVEYQDMDNDASDFSLIGRQFAADTGLVRSGKIACADVLLMPQRALVDYAVEWMEKNRL